MKKRVTKLLALLLIFCTIITQSACSSNNEKSNDGYKKTTYNLDTVCTITVYGMYDEWMDSSLDEDQNFAKAIDSGFALLREYEALLSKTKEGSEIWKINHADGEPVKVSDETFEVIKMGYDFGDISDGKFDITIGTCSELWDFHEKTGSQLMDAIPSWEVLEEALEHVGYKGIILDNDEKTVRLMDHEAEIDLGGIAKGYIADKVAQHMRDLGVVSCIVNLGGNIAAVGGKSLKKSLSKADIENSSNFEHFLLGVKDPRESSTSGVLGVFKRSDITLVTSGTYERFFEVDGTKYHHILDPETGYPRDTDVLQVTLVSKSGNSARCDGLSTLCLILGMEDGLKFMETQPEFEAIFMDVNGKVELTSGVKEYMTYEDYLKEFK